MHSLTPEENILFLSSRLNPGSEDIRQIRQMLSPEDARINHERLIQMAIDHGVAPLLFKTFKKAGAVSADALEKLKSVYLEAASFNLRNGRETLNILNALKEDKIDAIPLKGAIASELVFKSPALYYGADIDILVRPADLQQAKNILIRSGYQYHPENEADLLSSHYHLVFFKRRRLVELHWNLVKRYFKVSPDFWWKNISMKKYMNQDILCLEPERYLIYLIFRLHSHMFYPLKFFVLVSEVCNRYHKEIDWNHFLQLCRKIGMKKLTIFCLRFINDYFGARIPEDILQKRIMGYPFFVKSIVNMLFREVKRPYLRKIMHVFLLDSRYHMFISFLKRICPGRSELRLRYNIPEGSRKIYIYYLLNPVLLPLLLLKKKRETPVNNSV